MLSRAKRPDAGIALDARYHRELSARSTALSGVRPSRRTPPCSGAAELGIVDYGPSRLAGCAFLNSAFRNEGCLNFVAVLVSGVRRSVLGISVRAIGVDAQKAVCTRIEKIMNEDVPAVIAYNYDFLSGFSKKFQGIYSSALSKRCSSSRRPRSESYGWKASGDGSISVPAPPATF